MSLRWGIASAGKIANDFVTALSVLPKSDHEVIAVAARSQEKADNFAKLHCIPKSYEGYVKLGQNSEVDIVYIGVLHPQHYEVSKLMLENGKHVLCEKPFTMNEQQTKALLKLAKEKNLFIMEGVWSRCFPVYQELRKVLDSGEIGEVKHASVEFGFDLGNVERLKSKDLGGGSILDLGIYVLQFQQFVYRGLKPTKVIASGHLNSYGTDDSVSAVLTYPCGQTAVVTANATVKLPAEALIVGTKGIIKIPNFWCPTILKINEKSVEFPLIENDGKFIFFNSAGLAYEAEEARLCIKEGKLGTSKISHEETLQLAQLMDTLRKQLGVVFPSDCCLE